MIDFRLSGEVVIDVFEKEYDRLSILIAIHLVCSIVEDTPNAIRKAWGRLIRGE